MVSPSSLGSEITDEGFDDGDKDIVFPKPPALGGHYAFRAFYMVFQRCAGSNNDDEKGGTGFWRIICDISDDIVFPLHRVSP